MNQDLQDYFNGICCPKETILLKEDGFGLLQEDNSNILI
jgi:hypothetical protein